MDAATPGESARTLDPGLSLAREAAKALAPRKASAAMKSATIEKRGVSKSHFS